MHFLTKKKSFKHTSYMHSKRNHAFIKAFFFRKNLSNMHYICIKKNHPFINVFSKRKSPRFHKCIFSQKKNHSSIHHICIQKEIMHSKRNHAFIKVFFLEKIFQTCTIYAFKKKSCIHKCIF